MAEKYDGWALKKYPRFSKPYFLLHYLYRTRKKVIEEIENTIAIEYKKWKRNGGKDYKIVKVKLIEVDPQGD